MKYSLPFTLLLNLLFCSFGQNGKIESKTTINISKTDLWGIISQNDTINPHYKYTYNRSYSEIIYKSDSLNINGLLIEPKAKGNYPVIIFNRGGNRKNRPELKTCVSGKCIPNYWNSRTNELTKRFAPFWAHSSNGESSLLLLCGSLNAKVNCQQSANMASKLDSLNYNCQLKIYKTNRGFRGKRNELNNEPINWFNTYLKKAPKVNQRKIAITIDDVPNTLKFQKDNYNSHLLEILDSLHIPISIFINEGLITRTSDSTKNLTLLEDWIKKEYVTIGNHTLSHFRYSDVGYEQFNKDIEKGEMITRQLAKKFNKPLQYFRFPYNDLGIDSVQQFEINKVLNNLNYKIAPFTIESSDWMFNAIYEHYLTNSDFENARKIGELYVSKTMEYIHFFDSLSTTVYGRNINQIYLCHDNSINSDYLAKIIDNLASEGYQFIGMDEAMKDPVYNQENKYYKKWGISWIYRWMPTQKERNYWIKLEPSLQEVEFLYESILNLK